MNAVHFVRLFGKNWAGQQWHTEGGLGVQPPTPEIPKALQNRAKLNPTVKTVKFAESRTPKTQNIRKKQ